jgi:opacity protein-like surface antigen
MKRTAFILILLALFAMAMAASAQVVPSAKGSRPSLSAGGLAMAAQPDYENGIITSSSNHLGGMGVFVDYRMSRWVQLEAESRWQIWNQDQSQSIHENTYALGLREPIHTFRRITPYGKAMIGFGSGSFLTGRAAMYALGGGADYRLNKRFSLRADFEYQRWRVTPTLHPYAADIGISYRIF